VRFASLAAKPGHRVFPDDLVIIRQATRVAFNLVG